MTYEEALKDIKNFSRLLANESHAIVEGYKINLGFTDKLFTTLITAEQALEKQIPKKPLRYIDLGRVGYSAWCPVCEGPVERGKGCSNNDCRQAIDWSEENDI